MFQLLMLLWYEKNDDVYVLRPTSIHFERLLVSKGFPHPIKCVLNILNSRSVNFSRVVGLLSIVFCF